MALNLFHSAPAQYEKKNYRRIKRISFVITLTDAQLTQVDIQKMLEAGMNIASLSMSSTTVKDRRRVLKLIHMATSAMCQKNAMTEWPVSTWLELKNCMVRTGTLEEKVYKIPIRTGTQVTLTHNINFMDKCNENLIFVDNPYLTREVPVGSEVSIAGNEIILVCKQIVDDHTLRCLVTKGGDLRNLSVVSVRGGKRRRSHLSSFDKDVIEFVCENEVDIIGIQYVCHVETVRRVKIHLRKTTHRPLVLSGICTEEGIENIDEIIKESDGIIIQRDILPYELASAKRYRWIIIEKWILGKCKQAGKPCFLSGGILYDSITAGKISLHEMFDLSNSLLDGASGIVLKNCDDIETTIECIRIMDKLCCGIEPHIETRNSFWRHAEEMKIPINAAEACMLACISSARQSAAVLIILPTVTGATARQLMRLRPPCVVAALSANSRVNRMMHAFRNIVPLKYTAMEQSKSFAAEMEQRIKYVVDFAVKKGYLQYGDIYVTLSRGSEASAYCDSVAAWQTLSTKDPLVKCDDTPPGDRSRRQIQAREPNLTSECQLIINVSHN